MKAIETEYGGVLFRSRLEARWAVFFDALGIGWQYEPEAYQLKDGTRYLPDFFVLGMHFVEVKPAGDRFTKARRFAGEHWLPMWLCDGEPRCAAWPMIYSHPSGSGTLNEGTCIYNPGKQRIWLMPSEDDCLVMADAVAKVRAYRFWNPRQAHR